nr:immunoglobulin light chain junction region [Macaca mulatta]MOW63959.1 immunoglobulin light chain junction region [Macaca mulatta]MOW64445.1 immunoglobulin light chain junction region [Macaca mulatta]MOW65346.1 immunoglobulin light chain junction region [Macaca mulatta]MOW65869.1 immunoglobulin light chain junction region [Macaca mulatta]
CQKYSDSPYNF